PRTPTKVAPHPMSREEPRSRPRFPDPCGTSGIGVRQGEGRERSECHSFANPPGPHAAIAGTAVFQVAPACAVQQRNISSWLSPSRSGEYFGSSHPCLVYGVPLAYVGTNESVGGLSSDSQKDHEGFVGGGVRHGRATYSPATAWASCGCE